MSVIDAHVAGAFGDVEHLYIFDAKDDDPLTLFTKKRMEIIRCLQQERHEWNVNEIADATGRKKEAVSRDLHALEKFGIVVITRQGKNAHPRLVAKAIVLNLSAPQMKAKSTRAMPAKHIKLA
jgi:predicted transcriptional regulator